MSYDSEMCCAPEDRRGYHEEAARPLSEAETHARALVSAAGHAVSSLLGIPGVDLLMGTALPEPVVREVIRYVQKGEVLGTFYCPDGVSGPKTHCLYSFSYFERGVRVHGLGTRPATAAEIATVAK